MKNIENVSMQYIDTGNRVRSKYQRYESKPPL